MRVREQLDPGAGQRADAILEHVGVVADLKREVHVLLDKENGSTGDGWRLPAAQIETIITAETLALLADRAAVTAALENAGLPASRLPAVFETVDRFARRLQEPGERDATLAALVSRVELGRDAFRLTVDLRAAACLGGSDDRRARTREAVEDDVAAVRDIADRLG